MCLFDKVVDDYTENADMFNKHSVIGAEIALYNIYSITENVNAGKVNLLT